MTKRTELATARLVPLKLSGRGPLRRQRTPELTEAQRKMTARLRLMPNYAAMRQVPDKQLVELVLQGRLKSGYLLN